LYRMDSGGSTCSGRKGGGPGMEYREEGIAR
jgi:hypothetical protein